MKKNLTDAQTIAEIIRRFRSLTPDREHLWGTMHVTEMLLHCTLANNFIFDDKSPYVKPTAKQRVKQFVCFNFLARLPKNRPGPARLETRDKIDQTMFETQLNATISSVKQFGTHNQPITSLHAGLGWLSTKQWGIVSYMHMDHHLRQFGA